MQHIGDDDARFLFDGIDEDELMGDVVSLQPPAVSSPLRVAYLWSQAFTIYGEHTPSSATKPATKSGSANAVAAILPQSNKPTKATAKRASSAASSKTNKAAQKVVLKKGPRGTMVFSMSILMCQSGEDGDDDEEEEDSSAVRRRRYPPQSPASAMESSFTDQDRRQHEKEDPIENMGWSGAGSAAAVASAVATLDLHKPNERTAVHQLKGCVGALYCVSPTGGGAIGIDAPVERAFIGAHELLCTPDRAALYAFVEALKATIRYANVRIVSKRQCVLRDFQYLNEHCDNDSIWSSPTQREHVDLLIKAWVLLRARNVLHGVDNNLIRVEEPISIGGNVDAVNLKIAQRAAEEERDAFLLEYQTNANLARTGILLRSADRIANNQII
jgi:hypothetical protein